MLGGRMRAAPRRGRWRAPCAAAAEGGAADDVAGDATDGLLGSGPALDFRARLGPKERAASAVAAATAVAAAAAADASPGVSLVAAIVTGGLAREVFIERLHAERYVPPAGLATKGSGFGDFGGLGGVHYRVHRAGSVGPGEAAWACHFFHGFGASLFSWLGVLQPVAEGCGGVCSAHDAPGFGLTEHPPAVESFSPATSARVGTAVLAAAVAGETEARREGGRWRSSPRRAIVAHSMGALSAMLSATSQPEGHYDAVVLVSPAVFLRVAGPRPWQTLRRLRKRLPRTLVNFGCAILRTMAAAFFLVVKAVVLSPPIKLLLLMLLRKLVRAHNFWAVALGACYHDSRRVTQKVVDGYRAVKETPGWDEGLLKYTLAMFKSAICGPSANEALHGLIRLAEAQELPILIVHGARDCIVSPGNSVRLAKALSGCKLSVWLDTGHLAHEEYPEKFAAEVSQFLCSVPTRA